MRRQTVLCVLLLSFFAAAAHAAIAPDPSVRFGDLVIWDPTSRIGVIGEEPGEIPGFTAQALAWEAFAGWSVHVDRRSGSPMLVQGPGEAWFPAEGPADVAALEARAREFIAENEGTFLIRAGQLTLNLDASGPINKDLWLIVFDRQVDGLAVEEQQVRLYVKYGRMISFGAQRWGNLNQAPVGNLDEAAARSALRDYMRLGEAEMLVDFETPLKVLQPLPSLDALGVEQTGRYVGTAGAGVRYRPVWRFSVQADGDPGIWLAKVDAGTGAILAFYDDVKYAQAKGGVFPVSNDGNCPDGCEQPDYPLPYVDVTIDGGATSFTGPMGLFECTPGGGTAVTNLSGQYVNITDTCGAVSESITCDADLDLDVSTGTDCDVPAGSSPGNTHAARVNFYHLNRVKEKGRYWLPGNSWLDQQLNANVNIDNNCNASWNGSVNFFTSGGGCRNTGEIGGVVHHEYGHGLDGNDGGGFDNSSESYADVTAIFQERISCVGPGFRIDQNCGGYGDTCLSCTGIREHDWDARQAQTPATPANFTQPNCGGGSGPCGRAVHCESYVTSETIFDLATRDLPATGLDADSSWQLAERLWYGSRQGSGGPIINCSLPEADSCNVGSWFNQIRMQDDDDGDLANGTPHAEAIYAAFARHEIACGAADDPENLNSGVCHGLAAPDLTVDNSNGAATLSWDPVAGADSYLVLRTEVGCSYSQNVVATVSGTSHTDEGLANGFEYFYRVQPRRANTACDGPVSACIAVMPAALSDAGTIAIDRTSYACSTPVQITVNDQNVGLASFDVSVFSDSEPTPESVMLFETAAGSGKYTGSISTTTGSTAPDGLVGVTPGDTLTARYVDADDGAGGNNINREATATIECTPPVISGVDVTGVTDSEAQVSWNTDTAATSVVRFGESTPPDRAIGSGGFTVAHSVTLDSLQACTVYSSSVESEDASGSVGSDDNLGQYYSFETLGNFSDGQRQCRRGEISIVDSVVGCANSFDLRLVDLDLNLDSAVADTVAVSVTSTTEVAPEQVTLTETGANTSIFTGSIATGTGAAVPADGILQSADGDLLTATYNDADTGSGSAATSFATGDADCDHSGISGIDVVNITDETAVVQWSTTEPSTSEIDWGATPALGSLASNNELLTSHAFTVGSFPECGRVYFRVRSTDRHGNLTVADADGQPFEFNVRQVGGAVFKDEFGSNLGWTLPGEWEIAPPQGFSADPDTPFVGTQVLGHDVTGQGATPGVFDGTDESAVSPILDASSLTNVELVFRRWLNTNFGTQSAVEVNSGGGWIEVFNTGSSADSSWQLHTIDISGQAAGAPAFQVRFRDRKTIGFGGGSAGWNVDRFVFRDGNQPLWQACGSCSGAPTFGGLTSTVDLDPCGDSGVRLSWQAAPSWGTGLGGSYAVYRDTDPGFMPSPANRIASGLTGTTFDDTTAPNDVVHHYIVRAENDETCDAGPNNGGVEDPNLTRDSVSDATSQPLPGAFGDTLRVDEVNQAHVRLSWGAVSGAREYIVRRADGPQGPFVEIGRADATFFEDRDEIAGQTDRYYTVEAVDSCGNAGP